MRNGYRLNLRRYSSKPRAKTKNGGHFGRDEGVGSRRGAGSAVYIFFREGAQADTGEAERGSTIVDDIREN